MKKLILSLLLLIASLGVRGQEISLPVKVVDSIIVDLARYDILKIEYSKLDSVATIQVEELATRKKELIQAKLTIDDYKLLVSKIERDRKIEKEKVRKLQRKIKWLKITHVLRTAGEIIIIIAIIAI